MNKMNNWNWKSWKDIDNALSKEGIVYLRTRHYQPMVESAPPWIAGVSPARAGTYIEYVHLPDDGGGLTIRETCLLMRGNAILNMPTYLNSPIGEATQLDVSGTAIFVDLP